MAADAATESVRAWAEALERPDERDAAASAIRGLIERVVLTPSARCRDLQVTLQGDLGTILE